MNYTFNGVADLPTAFASSATGSSSTPIPVTLGGNTTDDDRMWGRLQSESNIYYIVETLSISNANATYGFVDSTGTPIGLPGLSGSWLLTQSEILNLHVYIDATNVTIEFRSNTIVIEEGGDISFDGANFTVTAERIGVGGNDTTPLPPIITGNVTASGKEDDEAVLMMNIAANASDTRNASVSVEIYDLPAGASVENAVFNPLNNHWIASAADANAGNVKIIPPENLGDFDGSKTNFTVEGVASNAIYRSTTGPITVGLMLNPVADGVSIMASASGATDEDVSFGLNINMTLLDDDGSEIFGPFISGPYYFYILLPVGVTISGPSGNYTLVLSTDAEASFATSLVNYFRIPITDLFTTILTPPLHFHGPISITIAGTSVETTGASMGADHRASRSSHRDGSSVAGYW
jgi:hypothetical protein